ncbi:reverse transcriptase/maturase family protein [Patescibacteria group bacterium]|nr:reverse transcriptase/maturase family protein [Patescibacteria group bacterium]MBU4455417.1 reverse transcriptase/maturase family protein [Patescibacteria group bacterium]MCG2690620.1 reverse transcriptase/maturase family protein [Candidatus Parcubacteria bacterium]
MKVYRNLFSRVVSTENLLEAWDDFKKGKRRKSDVQLFERHLEDNLFQLHRDLTRKRYRHGEYVDFYVRDPKLRHIHKATVRDRVVHHAVFRLLNPIFESTFVADSYSCRKRKGTHKGVARLGVYARKVFQTRGVCFALKCDIRQFFPTIDHQVLLEIIGRRIKDRDLMDLIETIVESFASDVDQKTGIKGAPIGNLTSQLFANIYMNELDQFVKHELKAKYYLRYTDDFVILHHDDKYLALLKDKIADFLKTHLDLSLHPNKVQIRKLRQGIDYLGYVSLPYARVPRAKVRRRIFRKLRYRIRQFKAGLISEESLMRSFDSYMGFLVHADSHKLREKLHQQFWQWVKEPSRQTKKGQVSKDQGPILLSQEAEPHSAFE